MEETLATCPSTYTDDGAGGQMPDWPDTLAARQEALALLRMLDADLLSNPSATRTLERWCETHRLASLPSILADRITDVRKAPTTQHLDLLRVGSADEVRYRRVHLRCAGLVLSEADNWYVKDRLSPEMNRRLDESDVPFGRVVQALQFRRRTMSSRLLWEPFAQEGGMTADRPDRPSARMRIPPRVLEHQAALSLRDGTPFSIVIETYTSAVLAISAPRQP